MRLIDADALKAWFFRPYSNEEAYSNTEVRAVIDSQPIIDAVPVVRCKDCKYGDWYTTVEGKRFCYCTVHGSSAHTVEDFCSYGEREDNE